MSLPSAQASALTVRSFEATPLAMRLANAAIAYASYLQKAIVPWNLAVYYPFSTDLNLPLVAFSLALLFALTALAFEFRRRYPYFTIGWFWYLGTLIPMIGLVQVGLQQMADRYAYFPFIGLYLALAGFVTSRRAAVAIVGVYGVLGFVQTSYWHDTMTLLDHTASITSDNSFLRLALGDGLMAEGRLDEAMEQYRKAVTLAPADPAIHCKWAEALFRYDTPESRAASTKSHWPWMTKRERRIGAWACIISARKTWPRRNESSNWLWPPILATRRTI